MGQKEQRKKEEQQEKELQLRVEFAEWVNRIRKKHHISNREKLAKMVYHFSYEKGEDGKRRFISKTYSKEAVKTWEEGKGRPDNPEIIVSLALIDMTGSCDACGKVDHHTRKDRRAYVQKQMRKYLGRELHGRNIKDALLLAATYGIYSVKELPEAYEEFKEMIQNVKMNQDEKKQLSIEKQTERMEDGILGCSDKDAVKEFVKSVRSIYYLGGRTVGERMIERYNSAPKEIKGLTFQEAVSVYAPRTAGSFKRFFTSDSVILRTWLLEFCIHMRFGRSEIEKILEDAKMIPLSTLEEDAESLLKANKFYALGSVRWFEVKAAQRKEEFMYRYSLMRKMSVEEKVVYLMALANYIEATDMKEIPPIDYLLEYIPESDVFGSICKSIRQGDEEKATRYINDTLVEITDRITTDAGEQAYQDYRKEFLKYLQMKKAVYGGKYDREEGNRLTLIATVSYSIFTGKIYYGEVLEEDYQELENLLNELPGYAREAYLFMKLFWRMFLEEEVVWWSKDKGFYLLDESTNRKSQGLDLDEVIEDIGDICSVYT